MLQGYNLIDHHDGNKDGNKVTPKRLGTFRFIQHNIKLVLENPKTNKNKQLWNLMSDDDANLYLFQETGLYWEKLPAKNPSSTSHRHSINATLMG
jgi:hypothetical protein